MDVENYQGSFLYLFRIFILRRLGEEKLRFLVAVFGIALGISVVVGVRIANDSSVRGFETALEMIAGKTSLEIVGAAPGFGEEQLLQLLWLEQYGLFSPIIDGVAKASIAGGEAESLQILGVDILRDEGFRDYQLVRLSDKDQKPSTRQLLDLLNDSRSIVLTEKFAQRHGLALGSPIELTIGDRLETLVVRGLLMNKGPARALNGNFALMDIAAAQWMFRRLGYLDRIELQLMSGISVVEAESAISLRLPKDLTVQRPSRRGQEVEKMLASFHFNLTALSYIALLVGLFLIYNTVSLSVITRRKEIGILRAVGISRGQILRLFIGEAGLLGALGCGLGFLLGHWIALGAVRFTSTTVDRLYIRAAAEPLPLGFEHMVLAFVVGMPLALLAAIVPALEASRVAPTTAICSTDWLDTRFRLSWRHRWLPLVLFGLAAWFSQFDSVEGIPFFGYAACLATVFGGALLVPAVLQALGRIGSRLMCRFTKIEPYLANANLLGSIPRISISVAALAISFSMLTAIAIMIGSFRETVEYWVQQTLKADLYVKPVTGQNLSGESTISSEVVQQVTSNPKVAAVDRFVSFDISYQGRLVVLGSGDFPVLLERGALLFKAPREGRSAMRKAIGKDVVIVSESFSLRHKKDVGDILFLNTLKGRSPFRVAAVYYDYSVDRGIIVLDRRTLLEHYGVQAPRSLMVYLKDGFNSEIVRSEILAGLTDKYKLTVHTNNSLRAEVLRIFDSTFAITYALELIAIFVAILGVASTIFTLVMDRKFELSVLRWVGAERRQVRRIVIIEATLVGMVSQSVGVVTGLLLSLILVFVINVQSFGWTIQFHIPAGFLVQSSLLILLATGLSGVYPGYLAARMNPKPEM